MEFDIYENVIPLVRKYSFLQPEFMKEIQAGKIRIRLLGGIVYKHFGGRENIGDLDYNLLVSEAGEIAAKNAWPAGIMPQEFFNGFEKSPFFNSYVKSRYHFDDNGLRYISQNVLDTDFTKAEILGAEIYIPTKSAFIREQQDIIDKCESLDGWRNRARVEKAERRIHELMAL